MSLVFFPKMQLVRHNGPEVHPKHQSNQSKLNKVDLGWGMCKKWIIVRIKIQGSLRTDL